MSPGSRRAKSCRCPCAPCRARGGRPARTGPSARRSGSPWRAPSSCRRSGASGSATTRGTPSCTATSTRPERRRPPEPAADAPGMSDSVRGRRGDGVRTRARGRCSDSRRPPEPAPAPSPSSSRPGRATGGRACTSTTPRGRGARSWPRAVAGPRWPRRCAGRARSMSASFSTTSRSTLFWLGAAALAGATVVGINPTRRGDELARDIRFTDCQLLVTDDAGAGAPRRARPSAFPTTAPCASTAPSTAPGSPPARSGVAEAAGRWPPTTSSCCCSPRAPPGDPKAVRCTQGRLAAIAGRAAEIYGFEPDDVCYCPMPLFHGNAVMALWAPALAVGASVALAGRFSASRFLADVRHFGATRFTYVGKALAYVLATPEARRRRRQPSAPGLRDRGLGTRPGPLRTALRLPARRGVRVERRWHRHQRDPRHPPGLARRPPADRRRGGHRSRHGQRVRPGALRRRRQAVQPRRRHRRDRQPQRGAGLRGVLQEPRRRCRAHPQRLVLDRRPRLPRRGRLLLLRGTRRGLAAGRLGELRGGADRTGHRAPSRHRRRRRLRRARPRSGDQVMAAVELRPGARFDPDGFVRLPRCPGGPRDQMAAALRAAVARASRSRPRARSPRRRCGPKAGSAPTRCSGAPGAASCATGSSPRTTGTRCAPNSRSTVARRCSTGGAPRSRRAGPDVL